MSNIRTIREWALARIIDLTPELDPGYAFHESEGTEPLIGMPKDDDFMRSVRVTSSRNVGERNRYVGAPPNRTQEVDGSIIVEIGFIGHQDDRELHNWADDAEENISTDLTQYDASIKPAGGILIDITRTGDAPLEDIEFDGTGNAAVLTIPYSIIYNR